MASPQIFRRAGRARGRFFPALALMLVCAAAASAFDFADVEARAEALAAAAHEAPATPVPDFLKELAFEQWRALRYRPGRGGVWGDAGAAALQPRLLLPGFILDHVAAINVVDEDGVRPVAFSTDLFDVGDENLARRIAETPLGFGGFTLDNSQAPGEPGIDGGAAGEGGAMGFIGTSHFQFRGRNANYGVFARPVAINTATAAGEEVPYFREMWLVKPLPGAEDMTVLALMDAPGMTGAFRMTVIPGTSAVLDVHARLFPRGGAFPAKVGLAPVAGMFLFSETTGRAANDYRPEVHNCDGLLVAGADGGWQWTPLKNPERLTIGTRELVNPKGFGLLQRDGEFDRYQDLARRFDRSPSVWIEPSGDWGRGRVELVEIPGGRDHHPNIVAYWVPESIDPAAPAAAPARELAVDYRVYWMPPGARLHELGEARHTRMARSAEEGVLTFVIDFEGEILSSLPADTGLTSVVEAPEQAPLIDKRLVKNGVTGGWRLTLRFRLPQAGMLESLLTAREGPPQLAFAAHLKRGENLVEPLTETWRHSVMP